MYNDRSFMNDGVMYNVFARLLLMRLSSVEDSIGDAQANSDSEAGSKSVGARGSDH